jgi:hypothetical protein
MTNVRNVIDTVEILLTVLLVHDGTLSCLDLKWIRIIRNGKCWIQLSQPFMDNLINTWFDCLT